MLSSSTPAVSSGALKLRLSPMRLPISPHPHLILQKYHSGQQGGLRVDSSRPQTKAGWGLGREAPNYPTGLALARAF